VGRGRDDRPGGRGGVDFKYKRLVRIHVVAVMILAVADGHDLSPLVPCRYCIVPLPGHIIEELAGYGFYRGAAKGDDGLGFVVHGLAEPYGEFDVTGRHDHPRR